MDRQPRIDELLKRRQRQGLSRGDADELINLLLDELEEMLERRRNTNYSEGTSGAVM